MRNLRSHSSPDRWRTGIRYDETQFAQASQPPPLTHHPHSFSRCRHVARRLAVRRTTPIVTRYGCGSKPGGVEASLAIQQEQDKRSVPENPLDT
jgi:hypothetical protein